MEIAIQNHVAIKHPKHDGQEGNKTPTKRSSSSASAISDSEFDEDKKPEKRLKFECPHCDYKSNTSKSCSAHIQTHFKLKDYMCKYCKKRFENQGDGNRHSYWKHPLSVPKIVYAPQQAPTTDEAKSSDSKDLPSSPEVETKKSCGSSANGSSVKSSITRFSCCHCNLKGSYVFVEEHLKAQHRNLPFLLRKEMDKALYLEMYKYKCGHCLKDSDSLMEAMDHWIKNHVTLDFKFSLNLFSSSLIKSDSEASGADSASAASEQEPSSNSQKLSSSRSKKAVSASLKPDSSSAPSGASDLEDDTTEDDLNDSFSSDLVEAGTDSELEMNKVTSSTSEDKDVLARCAYCRRVSKKHSDIYEHIRTVSLLLFLRGERAFSALN